MATMLVCDLCEREMVVRNHDDSYLGPDYDWIRVSANEDEDQGVLCSWVCLATWTTNKALDKGALFKDGSGSVDV